MSGRGSFIFHMSLSIHVDFAGVRANPVLPRPVAVLENCAAGSLDGMTLVRFAHAFESGGGMERLLHDLDCALLERNAMTIIRIHIAGDCAMLAERTSEIGRGRLLMVPLPLADGDSLQIAPDVEPDALSMKERLRNRVLYHPWIWALGLERWNLARAIGRRSGQVVGAGAKFAELADRFHIDLCMLHFFGGSDADEIVAQARLRGIPFALQNHYSNDRFLHLSIRKHATLANGVAGVNGLDLPDYVADRFCNLSDGIDVRFFERSRARLIHDAPLVPLILLPARVIRPKGHLDLVRVAACLKAKGFEFQIGFAGRVESTGFVDELRAEIAKLGLRDNVRFLGALGVEELRDWYAASAVVAFPTYHHEGLGRVMIEAQAMEVPVVAYATGGVPEGVKDCETGFIVRTGDIEGMTARLELLLTDSALRTQMGQAGRNFVESHFSLEAVAARHEDYYNRLTRVRRRAESEAADRSR